MKVTNTTSPLQIICHLSLYFTCWMYLKCYGNCTFLLIRLLDCLYFHNLYSITSLYPYPIFSEILLYVPHTLYQQQCYYLYPYSCNLFYLNFNFASAFPCLWLFFLQVCENHPQGVVLVKFKDRKDAEGCIELMNGRW